MNQFYKSILFSFLISVSLFAKVIESKKMSEMLSAVTPNTLVIFDLDNTIMEAAQTIGSDQWFEHRVKTHQKFGLSIEDAVKESAKEWEAVNYKGRVRLVENDTPAIIEELQNRGIRTMGLTARPATFLEESLRQLRRLDVNFSKESISHDEIQIIDKDVATYKEGLMSVGGNNKGVILIKLLKRIGYRPSRVVFVDDKLKNAKNVDDALNAASIPSFAFRYGYADEKVASFNSKLADFQYQYFLKTRIVITDDEARRLMGNN